MLRVRLRALPEPVEIPVPIPDGLELTFDDIANVPVADASSVSDWNTFFDLPTYGSPFTSVVVDGDKVILVGGGGITLKDYFIQINQNLLQVDDKVGCVVEIRDNAFAGNENLHSVSFPACIKTTSIGESGSFGGCILLNYVNMPAAEIIADITFMQTNIGTLILSACENLGSTTGDDDVFFGITGKTITLTIPAALMTCNAGNPDGDIQYLQANNTVTIVTV